MKRLKENDILKFQEQLDRDTDLLEMKMLSDKPWYMKGEITAADREEDTVLSEHLDIQRVNISKPTPANEDAIMSFITKAIKERCFDSPVLKVKENLQVKSAPIRFENMQQKSLTEEYESLLLKNKVLQQEQESPEKEEIRKMIVDLFSNLDALSNLHYTPRMHIPDIKVVSNRNALAMELAGPSSLTTGDLLAPEEVCAPRGELIKGASELTGTDKRRHRKKLMRQRAKKYLTTVGDGTKVSTSRLLKTDKKIAMDKLIRLAHKPGSNIKIIH